MFGPVSVASFSTLRTIQGCPNSLCILVLPSWAAISQPLCIRGPRTSQTIARIKLTEQEEKYGLLYGSQRHRDKRWTVTPTCRTGIFPQRPSSHEEQAARQERKRLAGGKATRQVRYRGPDLGDRAALYPD